MHLESDEGVDKIEKYFLDERLDWFPVGSWNIMKGYFRRIIN